MKQRAMCVVAVVVVVLAGVSVSAQEAADARWGWCSPEGTWHGMNFSEDSPYIINIDRSGFGRYTAVAEGLTHIGAAEDTSWRGELIRTGARTFVLRQLTLYRTLDGITTLAAAQGEVAFTSCHHFDFTIDLLGFYVWRPGIVPFVEPFDVPYVPPGSPLIAAYDRMPSLVGHRGGLADPSSQAFATE